MYWLSITRGNVRFISWVNKFVINLDLYLESDKHKIIGQYDWAASAFYNTLFFEIMAFEETTEGYDEINL